MEMENQPLEENPQPKYNEPKGSKSIFIGLIAVILVILGVVVYGYFIQDSSTDQNMITEETEETTTTNEPTPVGTEELTVHSGEWPTDWADYERATTNIQTLGEGQNISGQIIVDPTDDNIVYFSSNIFDNINQTNKTSIYRYYMDNHNFERLYRAEFESGQSSYIADRVPGFSVYGYDNGRLIILIHEIGASVGPCTSPYLLGTGDNRSTHFNLVSMNIEDPYSGFEEYNPEQEVLDWAEAEITVCQENL